MEHLSEPLALFLETLLEDTSTVRVVVDNFRGLGEDDAESYFPPPPSERISDTSLPELSRWGDNNSSNLLWLHRPDTLQQGSSNVVDTCHSFPPSEAPKVPRRRTSLDSYDDYEEYWAEDGGVDHIVQEEDTSENSDDDEEEDCQTDTPPSSSNSSSTTYSTSDIINNGSSIPTPWEARFAALQDTILTRLEQQGNDLKDDSTRSPPKAPQRQNSLLRLDSFDNNSDHTTRILPLVPTNISLPDQEELERSYDTPQRVARRRYGVCLLACGSDPLASMLSQDGYHHPNTSSSSSSSSSSLVDNPSLVLEKIHREVCILENIIPDGEGTTNTINVDDSCPMFNVRPSNKQDASPSYARRRPSPLLDKLSTGTTCFASSSSSSSSMDDSTFSKKKSPCCAKRRPSPQLDDNLLLKKERAIDNDNNDDDDYEKSPVRAKRRPSPEYESFGNLVEALTAGGTNSILEEPKQ